MICKRRNETTLVPNLPVVPVAAQAGLDLRTNLGVLLLY
jgi:hypothetical protein